MLHRIIRPPLGKGLDLVGAPRLDVPSGSSTVGSLSDPARCASSRIEVRFRNQAPSGRQHPAVCGGSAQDSVEDGFAEGFHARGASMASASSRINFSVARASSTRSSPSNQNGRSPISAREARRSCGCHCAVATPARAPRWVPCARVGAAAHVATDIGQGVHQPGQQRGATATRLTENDHLTGGIEHIQQVDGAVGVGAVPRPGAGPSKGGTYSSASADTLRRVCIRRRQRTLDLPGLSKPRKVRIRICRATTD